MGGGQQYYRNKVLAMEELGFEVNLISCDKGTVYINELKRFEKNIVNEMRYPPFCFTKKTIERTLKKISSIVGNCDETTIIESVNPATSEWAELFAKRNKCKNITFLLDEGFEVSRSEQSYFDFKLNRNELSGMDNSTLKLLFDKFNILENDKNPVFDATCTNVVEDVLIPTKLVDNSLYDCTIGIISRLEKAFVIPTLIQLKNFAQKHSDKKIRLLIIGGTDSPKITKKIVKLFRNIKNLKLSITGYIYPIPYKLLKTIDVALSTAGSAIITAVDYDIPTISIDTFSGEAIGILDYTTKELMYKENVSNSKDLEEYLNDILFEQFCRKNKRLGMSGSKQHNIFIQEMKRQLAFSESNKIREYFDINCIQPANKKYKMYRFIGKVFGPKMLYFLHIKVLKKVISNKGKNK